jgi:hypothetical protein
MRVNLTGLNLLLEEINSDSANVKVNAVQSKQVVQLCKLVNMEMNLKAESLMKGFVELF